MGRKSLHKTASFYVQTNELKIEGAVLEIQGLFLYTCIGWTVQAIWVTL